MQLRVGCPSFCGAGYLPPPIDPLTGNEVTSFTYPHGSSTHYFCGSLSMAMIRDGKHRVIRSYDWVSKIDSIQSQDRDSHIFGTSARSTLDIFCHSTDTATIIRPFHVQYDYDMKHEPTGLEVTQHSMSWANPSVDDFVVFDYVLKNVSSDHLRDVFVGIVGFVFYTNQDSDSGRDGGSLTGYLEDWPSQDGCFYRDTVELVYVTDNDGNPTDDQWTDSSALAAVGVTVLQRPDARLNFNWTCGSGVPDSTFGYPGSWGPREQGTPEEPFRDFGIDPGIPWSDENYYYFLSKREFDYNQILTAIDKWNNGWLRPPPFAAEIADGRSSRIWYSFGPLDMNPGDVARFTIAIVGGDSVHTDPTAFERLFDPYNPYPYYNQLDFSNLAENARWAQWVYDNPGIDTDGDGYAGEFRVCDAETTWYKGDGIPDFRADLPPPAPKLRIYPTDGKFIIRWNGYESEKYIDPFTRTKDFEGYRLYLGRDSRETSMSVITSWDAENYNRFKFTRFPNGTTIWDNTELPFTKDSLRVLYNDSLFEPLNYSRSNPFRFQDTLYYYFERQDYNVSALSPSGIHKAYPDATRPQSDDSSTWAEAEVTYEHGNKLPKFYEYEYVMDQLLPSVPYHVSVTAFDFGYAKGGVPAKEGSIYDNMIQEYAQTSSDTVLAENLDVYVYPNPYRIDQRYTEFGFEDPDQTQIPERARRIHFANLPPVCTISIYSLDGDLIRTLEHNYPNGGPGSSHHIWNMITRNTQLAVSGLYYWVVEAPGRTQMGKLVIIK